MCLTCRGYQNNLIIPVKPSADYVNAINSL